MYCPECDKNEDTSRAYTVRKSSTMMGCYPFYDKKGYYHFHNPNDVAVTYECPKKHSITVTEKEPCWCGWPETDVEREVVPSTPMPDKVRILLSDISVFLLNNANHSENACLLDRIQKIIDPKIKKPEKHEMDTMEEIDEIIVNAYAFAGSHEYTHDRERRRNSAYAKVYEAKKLIQLLEDIYLKHDHNDPERPGPMHPVYEAIKNMRSIIDNIDVTDEELSLMNNALQVDRECYLADRERIDYRLPELEYAVRGHFASCLEREAFCPAAEMLQQAISQYK